MGLLVVCPAAGLVAVWRGWDWGACFETEGLLLNDRPPPRDLASADSMIPAMTKSNNVRTAANAIFFLVTSFIHSSPFVHQQLIIGFILIFGQKQSMLYCRVSSCQGRAILFWAGLTIFWKALQTG
jgi:hypothetical protein